MPAPAVLSYWHTGVTRSKMTYGAQPLLSTSYTVPAGTDLLVVNMLAGLENTALALNTPTFNGAGLTTYLAPAGYGSGKSRRQIFYLVSPASGARTFNLSFNGSADNFYISCTFACFGGVDKSNPFAGYSSGIYSGYTTNTTIVSDPGYYIYALVHSQGETGFDNKSASLNYSTFGYDRRGAENQSGTFRSGCMQAHGGKAGAAGSNSLTWSSPYGVAGSDPLWYNINIRGASRVRSQVIWFI